MADLRPIRAFKEGIIHHCNTSAYRIANHQSLNAIINHCFALHIQLRSNQMAPLLNKFYWNEGILNVDRIHKSATRLLNRVFVGRWGLDLSKEVLWVKGQQNCGQSKLEVKKHILPSSPFRTRFARAGPIGRIYFFELQLWQPAVLLPFDLQRPIVPLEKNLNPLCWHSLCPRV